MFSPPNKAGSAVVPTLNFEIIRDLLLFRGSINQIMSSSGDISTQTSSFQNQPPAEEVKKRRRDMACVSADLSNLEEQVTQRRSRVRVRVRHR